MVMLTRIKYFTLLVILFSCVKGTINLNNVDLLFPNSLRIRVKAYSYDDGSGNIIPVSGDTIYYTEIPDTLNNAPVFEWDSLVQNFTTVAIFKTRPIVTAGKIINTKDIIWQWYTGMTTQKIKGQVKYFDGRNVINDSIAYNKEVLPLNKGNYYWAVWNWTNDGTVILMSSRVMWFSVPE
jgi:hypothetical protein